MHLSNDIESLNLLITTVHGYYKTHGARHLSIFSSQRPSGGDVRYFIRFLVDRKHVVEYSIGYESKYKSYLCAVALGIGPAYFGPADFWSYEQSERFTMMATTEGIVQNLELLDEFLAPRVVPEPTPSTQHRSLFGMWFGRAK